jgi:DNA-binding beta-propeller fold protein YncE
VADASFVPEGPLDYWVYVTAESADEVYQVKFDGTEATVQEIIPVGYQPPEIEGPHGLTVSPDGEHWFVTMAHGYPYGILYKYTTADNELVGQTELGLFPATMQISPATGLLYCVNFDLHGDMSPSTVSIVDPDAMVEVWQTTTGPMPHGSRISPDGLHHYSCSMMDGQLYEIDAARFTISRVLKLDEASPHADHAGMEDMAMEMAKMSKPTWVFPHPDQKRLYVALNGVDQIAEVDLEKWEIIRRFDTDKGPYNVEVTADGKKLLVSYKSAGAMGIWDIESGTELAHIPSSRKITHGVVIPPDGRYGFVSSEGIGGQQGTLDVIDMQSNELVATVALGLQAGGIAFWKAEPQM